MKRFFSIKKKQVPVLITLSVVILMLSYYFFIYLPANERNLKAQRFRVLENIDVNIQAKISNSTALLENLLRGYLTGRSVYKKALGTYIRNFPQKDFELLPITYLGKDSAALARFKEGMGTETTISIDSGSQNFTLLLTKKMNGKLPKTDSLFRIGIRSSLQRFAGPLLPAEIFDEYLIFQGEKVVWESFPSGIITVDQDSILASGQGISGGGIRSISARGKDYKLFLQPIRFGNSASLVVAGLLSSERYAQEKKQLQMNIVMLLTTLVIIIIVAFPWLKLYQTGNKDMLTLKDGMASVVVAILLCSLFFFVFFKYNLRLRPDHTEDAKKNLADAITRAFTAEIDSAYQALYQLDALARRDTTLRSDIRLVQSLKAEKGNFYEGIRDSIATGTKYAIERITIPADTYEAFWMAGNGKELFNWTSRSENAPHNNFAARAYFNRIARSAVYHLNGDPEQPYFLDQIVSWTRGGFTSVVSKRSVLSTAKDSVVAAMSFNLKALQNAVITAGYQFAVINSSGAVIYHMDPAKNLNENLMDEFSEKNQLISCLQAGTTDVFMTNYGGKTYTVRVQPIANLPYFMVILSDITYKETRDIEVYSFTIAMMLCFFTFLSLQLILTFLISAKKNLSKKQKFDTSWLAPKISSATAYNQSVLINLSIILLLIISYQFCTFLQFFFILLFAVSLSGLFLNLIFLLQYKAAGSEKFIYKRNASATLAVVLLLTNFLAMQTFSIMDYLGCMLFQLAALGFAYLIFKNSRTWFNVLKRFNQRFLSARWTFTRSFTLMVLTRLIITSGIPILFFYISIYNYEQNLNIRYRQVQFADQLLQKFPGLDRKKIESLGRFADPKAAVFKDNVWVDSIAYSSVIPDTSKYGRSEELTLSFFRLFRIYKSDHAIGSENFYYTRSDDGNTAFNHLLREASKNAGTVTYRKLPGTSGYLKLSSAALNYKIPLLFLSLKGSLFWLCLFLGLYILYLSLHSVIKKLFAQNLPSTIGWEIIDQELLNNCTLNNLLFIIGLPGSGKLEYVMKGIENKSMKLNNNEPLVFNRNSPSENNVFVADLIVLPEENSSAEEKALWKTVQDEVLNDKYKLLIINHFEYNLKDPLTNNVKLNFLEKLMLEAKAKIMILSTVHPVTFLDSLNLSEDSDQLPDTHKHDLERWHVLLGHFRILIQPLQVTDSIARANQWEELIINETSYTHFLKKMQQPVISAVRASGHDADSIDCVSLAFKLHATSHYFYMYIWQSLTREEKFILYDLAEEGLVNSFDEYNLSMLISKGAIIQDDGRLKLFNRGFQDFILTAIGTSEAMKIRNEIKDNGNWSALKGPLQLIIIAILGFLFASQQETYSKILTYAAALGAGIPTVLKLFSFFDKGDAQKT